MDPTIDARRESAEARQRLTDISLEMARRTSPENMRTVLNEQREQLTNSAMAKVDELKEEAKQTARETVHELKERAVSKTSEMKEQALTSPALMGAIFGFIGAEIGMALARGGYFSSPSPYRARGFDYGLETDRTGVSSTIRDKASEVGDKASEAVSSAREAIGSAAESVREKIPSGEQVKETVQEAYQRAVNDYPLALALGAIGFGVLASILIPETDVERRRLGGLKQAAREQFDRVGGQIQEKISGSEQQPSGGSSAMTGDEVEVSETVLH